MANKVILTGRLTKDPEVRYSQGENAMCIARYNLAVDRRGKDKEADFISCVAFGKTGEFAEKYLKKGMKILISGRIQTGNYTDKESGKKVYTTDVVVEEHEFCESKNSGGGESAPAAAGDDEFMKIDENDSTLPF